MKMYKLHKSAFIPKKHTFSELFFSTGNVFFVVHMDFAECEVYNPRRWLKELKYGTRENRIYHSHIQISVV